MKELQFLDTIKSIIGTKYIGDDCAYLSDLGIVVSQDSLVEDVHFRREYITAFQLGYKSMMVNVSDICASGANPKYVSISLSLPKFVDETFVREFYEGVESALDGVEIIGGDITGSEKIMVSVCIIGVVRDCRISSRANAKSGQVIVTTGVYGSSAGGLELLLNGKFAPKSLVKAHLEPMAQLEASKVISKNIQEDYAMMDTSDGIADALFKIAKASNKVLKIDFEKLRYDEELKSRFPDSYKEKMLFGGEDYQLVATVPKEMVADLKNWYVIGDVLETSSEPCVQIVDGDEIRIIDNLENCFNHF